METKEFKAESKRLLEMMIHSIYTHKEIFLRELISNASDAMDKLYFKSMNENIGLTRSDFSIRLDIDKDARTITITDNGIGMTKEELENNLGTIAQSGSLAFKNNNETGEDVNIIGQFGVGFYSAFMVSKQVTVYSKAYGAETAYKWQSEGVDGYTIEETDKDSYGTKIVLEIKDNTDDENYDEFTEPYRIKAIVKKYSDYIRYPIKTEMKHEKLKEGTENEYETETVDETLNSMIPIWKKNKAEITDEEYNSFYKDKFYDFEDPLHHIHTKTEGNATYSALLYIPSKAPYDYYTKEYEKGVQLYSNGIMIMDKCGDLIPDFFSFIRGLVDSEDLSLNISREMLQHDRQLKLIEKSLEKSIKSDLKKMLKNDRENYAKFWKAFGTQIKYGVYDKFGANKELLTDLLMFVSSNENKLTTLEEYKSRMKEEQKYIYFASGASVARIESLPQTEAVKDKGYEILYFTDSVDEFAIQILHEFDGKEFKSVSAGDLDLETPEEKEEIKTAQEENKDMFEFMKDTLKDKVKQVKLSQRLKTHPVCLSSEGQLSLEMEKVLNTLPNDNKVKAEKVLELNAQHPLFNTLKKLYESDKDKLATYAEVLYDQALLIEGMPIENPVEYTNRICKIMAE